MPCRKDALPSAGTSDRGYETWPGCACLTAKGNGQLLQRLLLSLPDAFVDGVSVCIWMGAGESDGDRFSNKSNYLIDIFH